MDAHDTKTLPRILLLLFFFFFLMNAGLLFGETNTIERTHDPIVITGAEVPAFLGESVGHIWVYRYIESADRWEVIPFQVDELDGSDSYFDTKNGVLDVNDEIVFLSKDLGDSTSEISWIDNASSRAKNRYRIAVTDPLGQGEKGWIYIYCSPTISESLDPYVNYFSGDDRVETATYEIIHGSSGFQGSVSLHATAGGDGKDFLDRQKIRLVVKIEVPILGSQNIVIKEEMDDDITIFGQSAHIKVHKKSVETVPNPVVRLHRKMILEILLTNNQELNEVFELPFPNIFYPTFVDWKSGDLEIKPLDEGKYTEMRLSTDLNSNSYGMIFYNQYNPAGVRVNGESSLGFNTTLQWPGTNWYLIVADPNYPKYILNEASIVSIIDLEGNPIGDVKRLYFKDDDSIDQDDTGDRKSFGDTGIQVTGSDMHGTIDANVLTYYLPENLSTTQAKNLYDNYLSPLRTASGQEEIQYPLTITVNHPAWGSVEVDPPGTAFHANTSVTMTALPNSSYGFLKWEGDIQGTVNPKTVTITGPTSVTAHFSPLRHIVIQTEPGGLRLIADAKPYFAPSDFDWPESSSHFVCVDRMQYENDFTRYQFQTWNNAHEFCQTYLVPNHQDTLTALFVTQHTFETSVTPNGAGTILRTPSGKWLDENSDVVLEAKSAANYVFSGWSGDLSGNSNPDTLRIDAPKSITAVFVNYDPVIALPDTIFEFDEDDTLTLSFQTLFQWIEDPNHPDSLLTINIFEGNHIGYLIQSQEQVVRFFTKMPNWNGEDTLTIQVSDPLGAADQDEMIVSVVSKPDFPGSFSLLSPENNVTLSEWPNTIDFIWETSIDPDAGDTVRYTFQLDTTDRFNSGFLIQEDDILDSFYTLDWSSTYGNNRYYWRVTANDTGGQATRCRDDFSFQLATAVGEEHPIEVPSTFVLEQNRPNPFNGETVIRFGLPVSSEVRLIVYNSFGQTVRTLMTGPKEPGYYTIRWDGRNESGNQVSTGLYFIEFRSSQFRFVKKAVLLR